MSRETLELLNEILGQVTLSASHPDFERQAARIAQARRELAAALAAE